MEWARRLHTSSGSFGQVTLDVNQSCVTFFGHAPFGVWNHMVNVDIGAVQYTLWIQPSIAMEFTSSAYHDPLDSLSMHLLRSRRQVLSIIVLLLLFTVSLVTKSWG